MKTLTGSKIPVEGVCYVDVEVQGQKLCGVPLYVVQGDGPALFGRDWLQKVKLNWQELKVNFLQTENSNPKLEALLKK